MNGAFRKLAAVTAMVRLVRNWPTMILDHLRLLPEGPVSYRLRGGVVILARAKTFDVNAIEEVWVRRDYTPPGFEVGPNDTVLDIGAHIGSFTVHAARRATAGRVFAFEPTEENYARLTANVASNALSNVTAIRVAVAGSSGARRMFMQAGDTVGHSLYPRGPEWAETTVETTTLEEFVAAHHIDRIDLLKLDCEGAEFDILLNAPDAVLGKVGKISMEVHVVESREPEALRRFLVSKGFDVTTKHTMWYAKRAER